MSVAFARGGETLAVGNILGATDNRIEVEWPEDLSALTVGNEVEVTVTRTVDGESHTSSPVTATVAVD